MAARDIEMQDFNDPDESIVDDDYDETTRPAIGRLLPDVPTNNPQLDKMYNDRKEITRVVNTYIDFLKKSGYRVISRPIYSKFTVNNNEVMFKGKRLFNYRDPNKLNKISSIAKGSSDIYRYR